MKHILAFLLIFISVKLTAQDIDVKKDIVLLDGKEVFKINGGGFSQNISVENMEGKKLIYLKLNTNEKNANGTSPCTVTFAGFPNLLAEYQPSIPVKKMLAKEIIQNDLITDGELNEENVYRYCNATMPIHQPTINVNVNTNPSANKGRYYTPVERNTDADFFVNGKEIKQDFKVIGTYKISTATLQGKIQKKLIINGANNTPIAEVKYFMMQEEAELFLFSKEKESTITIPNANDFEVIKDIAKYLTEIRQL